MNKVNVEVARAELRQGQVEIRLDVGGAVGVVPQLGNEGEVFALDGGLGDSVSDLGCE